MRIDEGDCRTVMARLAENSVDSIITDPPYELSQDGKASPAWVALKIMFPENPKLEALFTYEDKLAFLVSEILALGSGGGIPSPSATMPVGSVALDHHVTGWNKDIEHSKISAVDTTDGDALVEPDSDTPKHLGDFLFKTADPFAILQVLNRAGCGFLTGGVGVGFALDSSSVPSLLSSSGAVVISEHSIGLINDAFSVGVGTGFGAKIDTVASLGGGGNGTGELFTAPAALQLLAVLKHGGAQAVAAITGTRGFPSMVEARLIRVVHPRTHRALTFNLILHPQSITSAGFMGKVWDGSKVAFDVAVWREAYRVLKPGGHLLSFGGSRTYHRMACAIEDAGFEIRDQIMWIYGSGFPKSYNVGQSIEKLVTTGKARRADRNLGGLSRDRYSGDVDGTLIADTGGQIELTTDEAKQWEGWGTALKPAHEPICVARKPFPGTVATNVLKQGTGAINIDGCRVGTDTITQHGRTQDKFGFTSAEDAGRQWVGRFPANVILDGSEEVVAQFPESSSGHHPTARGKGGISTTVHAGQAALVGRHAEKGSAARFFYHAKANKKDRRSFDHPTVKPIALMRYLTRLVTPPGGTVLDPFAGTGTTGEAAMLEGFVPWLIEMDQTYIQYIHQRLAETYAEINNLHPGANTGQSNA